MSFQAVFRKATVLYEMGQVDKSLQVFLQCLVLDESFPCAKRHMEKVSEFGVCDRYRLISCVCVCVGA